MKPVCLFDVDNIMHDYSAPAYEEMCRVNPAMPSPDKWDRWDLETFGVLTKKELHECFHRAHMRQMEQLPFLGTSLLLHWLREYYRVVIATHRRPEAKAPLIEWLDYYCLPYDDLYVGNDKTTLFGDAALVIDDCPDILRKATEMEISAIGLAQPWNINQGFTLFSDTQEMLTWVAECLSCQNRIERRM